MTEPILCSSSLTRFLQQPFGPGGTLWKAASGQVSFCPPPPVWRRHYPFNCPTTTSSSPGRRLRPALYCSKPPAWEHQPGTMLSRRRAITAQSKGHAHSLSGRNLLSLDEAVIGGLFAPRRGCRGACWRKAAKGGPCGKKSEIFLLKPPLL